MDEVDLRVSSRSNWDSTPARPRDSGALLFSMSAIETAAFQTCRGTFRMSAFGPEQNLSGELGHVLIMR
jgi:hypothetical protein